MARTVADFPVKNLTVYRITPRNYSKCLCVPPAPPPSISSSDTNIAGVTNLNTGDAYGDVFFGIYELAIPELCRGQDPRQSHLPQCQNVPILSIPNFNVYGSFVIEYQDRFGPYNECNPDPNDGAFHCRVQQQSESQLL